MRTSDRGRAFIGRYEGLRLVAYRDVTGIWTIGYGHTSAAGPPAVRPGLRITRAEAEVILTRDLARFEHAVHVALPQREKTLAPHEFDALVSLAMNIGPSAFARSTVARLLANGDREGAADAFLLWNKAGNRIITGLVRRRAAERRLFLTGRYETSFRAALVEGIGRLLAAARTTFRRLFR